MRRQGRKPCQRNRSDNVGRPVNSSIDSRNPHKYGDSERGHANCGSTSPRPRQYQRESDCKHDCRVPARKAVQIDLLVRSDKDSIARIPRPKSRAKVLDNQASDAADHVRKQTVKPAPPRTLNEYQDKHKRNRHVLDANVRYQPEEPVREVGSQAYIDGLLKPLVDLPNEFHLRRRVYWTSVFRHNHRHAEQCGRLGRRRVSPG